MSKCENGSTLYWNDETKTVMLEANVSDKCYLYFDKYSSVNITNVSTSNITNSSITLTVTATAGRNAISKYYFSSNGGSSYVESTSNTYTFSGLSTGTEYDFRVYAVDSAGYKSNVYSLKESTSNVVYLADYIKGLYTTDGTNGLYLHDGSGTYGAQEAGDNSYRYAGANSNNYVCFGSDAASCPSDNLYRIIGVFGNQVKLIKNTSIGNNYWSGSSSNTSNTWSSSTLNTGTLKLIKIKDNIDNYIDLVNNKKKDFVDSLYELTKLELGALEEKRMLHAIQFAGFPYYKCLDDFDFSFQPSINKEQIIDFKNLRFIENKENILFVGSPGVGKTHLATAIGIENAKTFKSTYFINCNDLISALKKALIQNRIEDKLKQLAKYKLLIIDEVGYLPIDNEGANLFFQLINKRYEKTPPL